MFEKELAAKFAGLMRETEDYIWNNPETGYKEFKTDAYLKAKIKGLGYDIIAPEEITGFVAVADSGKKGPTVAIFAELDSVICRTHPDCDKQTGAVHACGHNNQCAVLTGFAAMLKEKGALDGLCGKIKLVFVPAEEGIELEFRQTLKDKGVIKYFSGKQEFIRRGYLDDVDLAFMLHAASIENDGTVFHIDKGHNGLIYKNTVFEGKPAHAGGEPHEGINAVNMAACALNVANNLRETFREKDYIRFHYIINHGGDAVNTIADKVSVESYVRAASPAAMTETNKKINRVFASVACAFGGNVRQTDTAGMEAVIPDDNMNDVAAEAMAELVGKDKFRYETEWWASSTDFGDIACLVPSALLYSHCTVGGGHANDFKVVDYEVGEVESAALLLKLSRKLLENNAEKAEYIIKRFKPAFKSREEYFKYKDGLNKDEEMLVYNADGTVTVKA